MKEVGEPPLNFKQNENYNLYQKFVRAALWQGKDKFCQILRAGLEPIEEVLIRVQLLPALAL